MMNSIAGSIAALLIIGAGLCLIVQATRWASRLFVFAILFAFFPVFASLAVNLVTEISRSATIWASNTKPDVLQPFSKWPFLLIIVGMLITGGVLQFFIRFKIIGALQRALATRFGEAAAADTISSYLVRALDGIWRTLKLVILVLVVLTVVFLII